MITRSIVFNQHSISHALLSYPAIALVIYTLNLKKLPNPLQQNIEKKRVYLTGFMGSGKSSTGPLLARRLSWDFHDLDTRIVDHIGTSIASYFAEHGEPAFRAVEKQQLIQTASLQNAVIATGGGALCNQDNMQWALQHGLVIYLEVSVSRLIIRLKKEQATRPMLLAGDGSLLSDIEIAQRISGLLDQRTPYYKQAHITVNTNGRSIGQVVSELMERLASS